MEIGFYREYIRFNLNYGLFVCSMPWNGPSSVLFPSPLTELLLVQVKCHKRPEGYWTSNVSGECGSFLDEQKQPTPCSHCTVW